MHVRHIPERFPNPALVSRIFITSILQTISSMKKIRIIGKPLPNIPWEDKPPAQSARIHAARKVFYFLP